MIEMIKSWVLSQVFIRGFKQIEKQNFLDTAMAKCYTVPEINKCWETFTDSVISLLEDAIGEVKAAKKWK